MVPVVCWQGATLQVVYLVDRIGRRTPLFLCFLVSSLPIPWLIMTFLGLSAPPPLLQARTGQPIQFPPQFHFPRFTPARLLPAQGAAVGFLLDGKVFAPELQRKDRHTLRLAVALSGVRAGVSAEENSATAPAEPPPSRR